ncbi:hypothetical protein PR048_025599 [Dryococelus australis]|uniref:Uncharacterized protein n=1 Tax=Dryococelus australis TaxID=614101 RepID=A0ABQ9GRT9_9NEOP|nr:hypothetical protein PR048_025599 [Dryococelus australis]
MTISQSSGNPFSLLDYTLEQWEVSSIIVPESTDPNPTGCNEADKIPRVTSSNSIACQFSARERVSARYYSNNKAHWKCGKVLKKLGKLHYLVDLDNGFNFKRHIDQLPSKEVAFAARKTVHFDPQPKSPMSDDCQLNKPNLGDLTEIMDPEVVLPEV